MTAGISVAYISPNGSTRRVAETLAGQLTGDGAELLLADLSDPAAGRALIERIAAAGETLLCIGSPVYNALAVPPVMAAIAALPRARNGWAVPFVTYGRACSGVALWQMAAALQDKGFRIAGAAKVLAVHSLMWKSDPPEGEGHPDADDLRQVRSLADTLRTQLAAASLTPLALEALDYQPAELAAECKARIGQPWLSVPKTVDAQACTECGNCVQDCPVGAIALRPMPEFGDSCFSCFNCVRLCPEAAITSAFSLAQIEALIRERVRTINEQPPSQVFLAAT